MFKSTWAFAKKSESKDVCLVTLGHTWSHPLGHLCPALFRLVVPCFSAIFLWAQLYRVSLLLYHRCHMPAFIFFSTTKVLFHFVTLSSVPTLFGLPTLPTLLFLSHQLIATRINWRLWAFWVPVSFLKSFLNIWLFSAFTDFPCVPSLSILDSHIDFPVWVNCFF